MEEPKMKDLEILERSCSIYLVRYLLHHPHQSLTMLMTTEGKSLSTKNRRLGELTVAGLISLEAEVDEDKRIKGYYDLTPLGVEVAKRLDEIYDLMKDRLIGCNENYTVYNGDKEKIFYMPGTDNDDNI
ncbi:MAG: hypothetical protein IKG94_02010 [Candidatus Methanomethylophilaceae archaeon]|nr:hypothetical protein [Candidatus Methanomethylophilaceae archaeon]